MESRELHRLVNLYPDGLPSFPRRGWMHAELSGHPDLSSQLILDNLDKPWNYHHLLTRPDIDIQAKLEIMEWMIKNCSENEINDISNYVIELPLIKRLIELNLQDMNKLSNNPNLNIDSLQFLLKVTSFQIDVQLLLRFGRLEVTRWLADNGEYPNKWSDIAHNHLISGEFADTVVDGAMKMYESDEIDNLSYLINNPCLNEGHLWKIIRSERFKNEATSFQLIMIIEHPSSIPQIFREILQEYRDRIIVPRPGDNRLRIYSYSDKANLGEETIEYLLENGYARYRSILHNKSATSNNLLNLIRRESSSSDKFEVPIAIIEHYNYSKKIADPIVIEELINRYNSDREVFKPIVDVKVDFMIGQNNSFFPVLIPIIRSIGDLRLVIEKVNMYVVEKFQFQCPVDYEIFQLIKDKQLFCKVNMEQLTAVIDYEIIIDHPEIHWNQKSLSTRRYSPSNRFLKTKRVS